MLNISLLVMIRKSDRVCLFRFFFFFVYSLFPKNLLTIAKPRQGADASQTCVSLSLSRSPGLLTVQGG